MFIYGLQENNTPLLYTSVNTTQIPKIATD